MTAPDQDEANRDTAVVGLVLVSHSHALASAARDLAGEMLGEVSVPFELAAGLDETTFGTDAAAIGEAIAAADAASGGKGVVVLMDLGSAVMSAELALELVEPDVAGRVTLCPAPLVEGAVVAAVTAAGGADRAEVASEAAAALSGKESALAHPSADSGNDVPAARTQESAQQGRDKQEADEQGEGAPVGEVCSDRFTVLNPHGLHARPAARLVQEMRRFDADVRLRNATTDSAWVPAASLSRIATLGAERGSEVEVRATGAQADDAVRALADLASGGFGEKPAVESAPPAAKPGRAAADRQEVPDERAGTATEAPPATAPSGAGPVGAAPGLALAPVFGRRGQPLPDDDNDEPPEQQRSRLCAALSEVGRQISRVRDVSAQQAGPDEAALFDAHLMLLQDPDLLARADAAIEGGEPAGRAWLRTLGAAAAELEDLSDPYLKARASDLRSVGDQVARALSGDAVPEAAGPSTRSILVAPDLSPAEAALLDRDRVAGVVLAGGSPTAHSAILTRARNIPMVVGAGQQVLDLADGTMIGIDGGSGRLWLDPSESEQGNLREQIEARREREQTARAAAHRPATTADDVPVPVGANVGSAEDAAEAAGLGADLVGLMRTEFLFLGRDRAPEVDEQEQTYRAVAEAMSGRRITFRTMDVGGDKPLPFLAMPTEANPFLGLRGLRLSLARPELLRDQLTALVRVAADTEVSIMFPMVTMVAELRQARELLDEVVGQRRKGWPAGLQVGMMTEVPAAALKTASFDPLVDFFSIGTNDLTQYTMAAERGNAALSALADPLDPAVLQLIAAVCRAASPSTLVAVCGELAADDEAAAVLVGLGVRELSVAPPAVPSTKESVRRLRVADAAERAESLLGLADSGEVRRRLAAQ